MKSMGSRASIKTNDGPKGPSTPFSSHLVAVQLQVNDQRGFELEVGCGTGLLTRLGNLHGKKVTEANRLDKCWYARGRDR